MIAIVLDKYAYYHNLWRRAHPNFLFSRVLWNAGVFCVVFWFFSFVFTLINLFHNIQLELLYSVSVSVQLTYLLYRNCVFTTDALENVQNYEDFFIFSSIISSYLLGQTVFAFVFISFLSWDELLYPHVFLFIYFALCAVYAYVEGTFFYRLWNDARWATLISQRSKNDKYEMFCSEIARRRAAETSSFFELQYARDPGTSVDDMVDAFATV